MPGRYSLDFGELVRHSLDKPLPPPLLELFGGQLTFRLHACIARSILGRIVTNGDPVIRVVNEMFRRSKENVLENWNMYEN